mmetsp:Transcript_32008/g.83858  ORF Transcript_32008/g.83858 Transcript_32008/m.83858 type:complete len:298 (-) Transcript_32008:164-1057(-)|eukprot:CAMPEP_0182925512 /NCGR_PEP_ID=MMETSP0105_2-20130417/9453_1 /TAXON_ID=81532 ORGANISM="Acanthoeca-like sp., Strain 10tr" /NCGR_SAMPLE_ID=MMETSP0105_2 /ASSEMBLY_ACC=CAM_ASM_000205 /LENGTH=297 /DNA_ID=CAMNT_0025063365 /DNA_START=318 /DNA_END=1211 /DNA_ORIENTATION=+
MAIDRTADFRLALQTQLSHQRSTRRDVPKPRRERSTFSLQFRDVSKRIYREISQTETKLEKLQMLVQGTGGLYGDNPEEIEQLIHFIKLDISRLNKANMALKDLVHNEISGRRKTHEQAHSQTVVVSLQNKLAAMSEKFKTTLQSRTTTLQKAKKRREEFAGWSDAAPVLTSEMPSLLTGAVTGTTPDTAIEIPQNQVSLLQSRDNYVQERADAMDTIAETIEEIGGIFQQLAVMVNEQGQTMERIDREVDNTVANVEGAHKELTKYFNSISSNRTLMLKIFGVLLAFLIFFLVVVA